MRRYILYLFILPFLSCGLLSGDDEEIPEICLEEESVRWWVNDVEQLRNPAIEPNTGFDLNYLYGFGIDGSWAIDVDTKDYGLHINANNAIITADELDKMDESQWEKALIERGSYTFKSDKITRRWFNVYVNDSTTIYLGDEINEVVDGNIKMSIEKTGDGCQYQVAEINANYIDRATNKNYKVKAILKVAYKYE